MQRRLVLTSESARHPFRRSLPPHAAAPHAAGSDTREPREDDSDFKLFLLSFAAFFTCFYTFIF